MPDRTIVITGATDGLGRALSGALARQPATTLILHGRNQSRLDELATTLADAPASIHTIRADFPELTQVHRLADEITDHISVLINNAGIGGGEPDGTDRRLTVDGHELRFAVNHRAPFALTGACCRCSTPEPPPVSSTSLPSARPRSTSTTPPSNTATRACASTASPNWP
ncbi:SDR family NAD(P)-dependent oxidoreductase [Streptomyces canus]|uniref:SDR family NAD(P)-dependent oxidoreductase n=1 Tax=Streptomyces canus TaxID=58343 RepID=UPI002E2E5B20|nr:SDR family NAD(P)-dependent oxidoreductase [Streptomyces canus]